ncbi:hypothetical protein ILUMI_26268 [Ignelater luminosus]|uniref:Uncharacterized protein n=1 Tax=Ignelater luminosus TaxID=2038154 RepID=A0A8K0FZ99_IGNLU|nr:hypothetical protein ILUMI_26268 [Ignelater luminosus]
MPQLKGIYAYNSSVEIVFPSAFTNLPEIDVIDLSYNRIEDVVFDVFNDLNLQNVVLSSNNISHIDRGAFSNMPRLNSLLLDNNNLREFNKLWLTNSTSVKVLDLSSNNILALWAWSFEWFPDLAYLDVSFNKITEIGLGTFLNVKQLDFADFSGNDITEVKPNIFYRGITVRELRFAMNHISSLSEELFTAADIHLIALHMNPWTCPDLKKVMKWATIYNVKILDDTVDDRINNSQKGTDVLGSLDEVDTAQDGVEASLKL